MIVFLLRSISYAKQASDLTVNCACFLPCVIQLKPNEYVNYQRRGEFRRFEGGEYANRYELDLSTNWLIFDVDVLLPMRFKAPDLAFFPTFFSYLLSLHTDHVCKLSLLFLFTLSVFGFHLDNCLYCFFHASSSLLHIRLFFCCFTFFSFDDRRALPIGQQTGVE